MKYFLYARKSTDEDDRQVLSIEAQITELREYAEKEKLEIVDEFIESKTAKVPGRVIFNKMIARVELGEGMGILAWHPDRLARNSVDGGKIIYLADTGKILGLKFPTFWFEATPQGKFMLNIAFGQSKYYIDNLSENIKRGLRQKLRRGERPGKAPVGYLNELRHHTIIRDPERAPLVVKLFEQYATGKYTLMGIEELALSIGLLNRDTNKPMAFSKLQEVLRNSFYYGVFKFNGEMYQGSHEPIISKQLFDNVQKVMSSRAKPRKQKKIVDFAFRGLMTCGECGRAITTEKKVKKSGKIYVYYRCTKKRRICSQKYVEEKELIKQINEGIQKVALSDKERDDFLLLWEKDNKEISTKSGTANQTLKAELKQLEAKQMNVVDAYVDKEISHDEYAALKQKIINRKVEISDLLKEQGNNWLGRFKQWILAANQANLIVIGENVADKRSVLQKIGSDFRLTGQKVSWLWGNPYKILAENRPFAEMSG